MNCCRHYYIEESPLSLVRLQSSTVCEPASILHLHTVLVGLTKHEADTGTVAHDCNAAVTVYDQEPMIAETTERTYCNTDYVCQLIPVR